MSQPVINPLQTLHEEEGALFVPYGEVVQIVESFGEVEIEYAAIRKGAALMDAAQRTVVLLTGKDRLAFLQNKVTNDTNRLKVGEGCYAFLLNLKGRIVMDMNILQTAEATLVEMDRRLVGQFVQMMEKYIFSEDVRVLDASEQMGRLTVLGPNAAELLRHVMDADLGSLTAPLQHLRGMMNVGPRQVAVTVFRNDLAGAPQYELIVPRDQLVGLWQALHAAGGAGDDAARAGVETRAIGWSAFNIARIEAGTPLFGIDITENYLPLETGQWYPRAVCSTKGCYLGQEIVARMHSHQTAARMFVGLRVEGENVPLAGTGIFDAAEQVGIVTSSCVSPMLGHAVVGMGYVKTVYAEPGRAVEVLTDGARAKTRVAPLPLWER
jgi:folate-binding protein YgfZ